MVRRSLPDAFDFDLMCVNSRVWIRDIPVNLPFQAGTKTFIISKYCYVALGFEISKAEIIRKVKFAK